jgi:PAS domain S-box-containing protein
MNQPAIILVVDDIAANRETLHELLDAEAYRVVEAADGPTALALAAETPPDLVLLDVMMPSMDGYEVCRRLRADARLAEVPVIMVTALDDPASRLAGLEAGADDFITKPYNRAELRARVRTITRLNRYRRLHEAQAALGESERYFRALFELGPVAIYSCDTSGLIREFNRRAVELWGRSPSPGDTDERFCGSFKLYRIDGTFMPHDQCPMAEVLNGTLSMVTNAEVLIERPDGSRISVVVNIVPLKNDAGEVTGAINCFHDITERKRMEEDLHQSEERYRRLLMLSPDAQFVHVGGLISLANQAFCQMMGAAEPAQLLGRVAIETVHPDYHEHVLERRRRHSNDALMPPSEMKFVRLDGSTVDVEVATTGFDFRGRPEVQVIARDISSRKQAEDSLRTAHRQLQGLLEHSPAVIYSFKVEDGRLIPQAVSGSIVRLLGYTAEEATHDGWVNRVHPEDQERVFASLPETLECGFLSTEYRVRHKNGHYIWVEDSRRVVRDAAGKPIEIAGVWTDITERERNAGMVRESERRLREMLENLELIALTLDKLGKITFCNDFLARLTGWTREEILDTDWFAKFIPHTNTDLRKLFFDTVEIGEIPAHHENSILTKTGELREIIWNNTMLRDDAGALVGTASIGVDVTDRKRFEESLARESLLLRTVVDHLPDYIYVKDTESRFRLINKANFQLMKLDRIEDVLGKSDFDFFPTEQARNFIQDDRRVIEQGLTILNREEFVSVDAGQTRCLLTTKVPLRNADGQVTGLVGISRDITERKQAQVSLQESEENYRDLFENANDLILSVAPDGTLLQANRAWHETLGFDTDEIALLKFLDLIPPDQREGPAGLFNDAIHGRRIQLMETEFVSKTGKRIVVEGSISAKPLHGQIVSLRCIFRDVTEKKQMEAQSLRNQRMESIGTLAGGIAHDLNNVLAPILLSIALLRMKIEDPGSLKMLEILETSAQRGADMVKQVLTFSRGVEGKRAGVPIKHLIKELQTIIQQTFPKSIRLRTELPKDLWALTGDATQLHQVLLNLCVNARDAMPTGGTLTIKLENAALDESFARMNTEAKAGTYVVLNVIDTGIGTPPHIRERIFDPFFTTKSLEKGTGLGLSMVRGIVKGHDGFISLDSEVGKGTHFKVYLPATTSESNQQDQAQPPIFPTGHGELILVVDDEAAILNITQQSLQTFGYQVLTASDGAEAIAICALNRGKIKVMLTDMMMPIMDGAATIRAARTIDPNLKIIAASGLGPVGGSASLKALNANAFLHKPYTAEHLLKAVAEVLESTNPVTD